MTRSQPHRRWLRWFAIAAFIPLLVIGAYGFFLASEANVLPWQEEPTAIADSITPFADLGAVEPNTPTSQNELAGTPAPANAGATSGTITFVIDPAQSEARYVVKETVGRLALPTEAIGKTRAIRGQLALDGEGKPVAGSRLEVDLRTLKSGEGQRDNFIQTVTLKNAPVATYEITGVQEWSAPLIEGQEQRFTIVGQMTINGVTKELRFATTAARRGNAVAGTAETRFTWADFGLKTPSVAAQMISVENEVRLELSVVAVQ